MNDQPTQTQRAAAASSLIHNWISLAGIILAVSSFFAVACLTALEARTRSG